MHSAVKYLKACILYSEVTYNEYSLRSSPLNPVHFTVKYRTSCKPYSQVPYTLSTLQSSTLHPVYFAVKYHTPCILYSKYLVPCSLCSQVSTLHPVHFAGKYLTSCLLIDRIHRYSHEGIKYARESWSTILIAQKLLDSPLSRILDYS